MTEGLGDEPEHALALLLAGFDDCQHRFDEAVAAVALGAETQLTPDHSVTQAAFTCVVGRLDFRIGQKRPQVLFVIVEFFAHAARGGAESAQQQAFHVLADRLKVAAKSGMPDRAVAALSILGEQLFGLSHQIVSETFELIVARINQRLEVS